MFFISLWLIRRNSNFLYFPTPVYSCNIVQAVGDQNHTKENEMQEGKMVLFIRRTYKTLRKEVKGKGERERYPTECRVPEKSKEK